MAIKYVSVTGGGDGSSPESRWTLAQFNANASGNTAKMAGGTYTTTILPNVSGSSGAPIIYEAETGATPVIKPGGTLRGADLRSRSYVELRGLTFDSTGAHSIDTNNASSRVTIDHCTFQCTGPYEYGVWWFCHVHIKGTYHILSENTFLNWLGMDGVQLWGDHHYLYKNDFSQYDTGHGAVQMFAGYCVVEHNYFRNKWSGVREITVRRTAAGGAPYDGPRNLIQHNIFYDIGYDSAANDGYPISGWAVDSGDGPYGDIQHIKLGGTGTIYRNNLFVGGNEAPFSTSGTYPYRACVQIVNYTASAATGDYSAYATHMRIYHNVWYDNTQNIFTSSYFSANTPSELEDNRWINNICADTDLYDFYFTHSTSFLTTWHYYNNIFTSGLRWSGDIIYSATDINSNPSSRFPNASGNLSTAPTFASPSHSAVHADRTQRITRAQYVLSGGAGVGAGRHLASVTATSSGTTIQVDDAWVFSDGNGIIAGDRIVVNGQTRTVTATSPESSPQTITVDQATSVSSGQDIYLEMFGTTPDLGIVEVSTGEEDEGGVDTLATPTLLDNVTTTTSGLTTTSNSVNAPEGVLVALWSGNNVTSAVFGLPATIGGTLGSQLTWTKTERGGLGNSRAELAVWYAVVPSGGLSGTVSVTTSNNCSSRGLSLVHYAEGFNTSDPVVQIKSATSSSTTAQTVTLDAAPQTGSGKLAIIASRSGTAVTHDADYTDVLVENAITSHIREVSYDTTPGSDTDTTWSGTFGGNGSVAMVLEIAAGTTSSDVTAPTTTITSAPSDPSAASTASFEFTGTDNVTIPANLTFEVQLDGGGWSAATSPKAYSGLSEAQHTFEVRAIDEAGNVDATPASYTWTVDIPPADTTPPTTTITDTPELHTTSTGASFSFTGSDDISDSANLTFEVQLDSGGWSSATSPKTYAGLSEGEHTFEVRAIDEALNTDATPASYTWTIDTTAPTTSITVNPNLTTTSGSARFEFMGTDAVTATASLAYEVQLDSGGWVTPNGETWHQYFDLAVGEHTFEVRAIDEAGNVDATPASYTWTIAAGVREVLMPSVAPTSTQGQILWRILFRRKR